METARNWCNAVAEHAETLGKNDFFILGEVAGGNITQDLYLAAARNIDAVLDIGNARVELTNVAKGLTAPGAYFDNFNAGWDSGMGSHRLQGDQHVIVLDDHDHVFGIKNRFSAEAPNEHQSAAATAIQLFTLGLPCIYYGTEQSLRGLPREQSEREWLTSKHADWLLREAMFGPEHPRKSGYDGAQGELDTALPGFGPEGTSGRHVFDPGHPAYVRIAAMTKVRKAYPAARRGRQYLRNTHLPWSSSFGPARAGELLAWSRVLDDQEILILVNTNSASSPNDPGVRGGCVAVDPNLAGSVYNIVCYTANLGAAPGGTIPVQYDGPTAFIDIPPLPPSEVLILTNDTH
jgi:glycosidase